MCIYICICLYMFFYILLSFLYLSLNVCMFTFAFICLFMFLSLSTYVLFVCVRVYVCVYLCILSDGLCIQCSLFHTFCKENLDADYVHLERIFFLYKLFKFCTSLNRYQNCALLLS